MFARVVDVVDGDECRRRCHRHRRRRRGPSPPLLLLLLLSLSAMIRAQGRRRSFVPGFVPGFGPGVAPLLQPSLLVLRAEGPPQPGPPKQRRVKKNKYASFSKTGDPASNNLDPFDALVSESESKKREMVREQQASGPNAPPPLDKEEQEALMSETRIRNKRQFPDTTKIDPYDPTTYGYVELGTILGPHGVRGEVKLDAVTDFGDTRLLKPGTRHVKSPNRRSPREIRLVGGRRVGGTGKSGAGNGKEEYLLRFRNINDRDKANSLKGCIMYAREEDKVDESLAKGEYLLRDLVGADVRLDPKHYPEREHLFVGTVGGIVLGEEMSTAPQLAQDLLEIILPRGDVNIDGLSSWRDELVLVPFVPQIVSKVNLKTERKTIFITPPDGLLDLSYVREEKVRIRGLLAPAKEEPDEAKGI